MLKKCMIEEPENMRWIYFYARDGIDCINDQRLRKFVKENLDKKKILFINGKLEKQEQYYFQLILIYLDLLLRNNNIQEILDIIKEFDLEQSCQYDIQFYQYLSKIMLLKSQYKTLLDELVEFRKNCFDKQESMMNSRGYHIDLLIGLLLFENMRYDDAKKYFDFADKNLTGIIDNLVIDTYLKIINKIIEDKNCND